MQWSQFVLQSLYLLKRSLTKRERWILRRKWATTCGVIPRKKETKIFVWSRKGNGRLSWYDPRLLNSNSRSFLNPRPMAPLQPKWKSFWSAGYPYYESRVRACDYLVHNVWFISWDLLHTNQAFFHWYIHMR